MNNKKRTSLKTLILLPVFILGALTIICNVMAINNIRTVNSNAADITDNCMRSVSDLGEIKNDIQVIHTLGLSHIIATDLNTMISVVGEINDNQEELEKKLDEYKKYVQNDDMETYNSLVSNYNTMKYELGNIMAYSALGKNEEAYAIANGVVSDSSKAIQKDIEVLSTHANDTASEARERLTSVYVSSLVSNGIVIIISVILIIVAIYCVMKYVIKPIIATNKDIRDIIDGIDNGEGDLTKRVRVIFNDEIADLGNGINLFMDKLQEILKLIIENTNYMENVVAAVNNLSDNANNLVSYLQQTILPEFQTFVDGGVKYKENASYIENAMDEFVEKTDVLKKNMDEIAHSINTITTVVDEGAAGVNNAAISTQNLVEDIVNISNKMIENKSIAQNLKNSTNIFAKF